MASARWLAKWGAYDRDDPFPVFAEVRRRATDAAHDH